MGISLLPFFSVHQALQDGSLVRLLPDHRLRERSIFALYPSRRFLDAKVRTWVEFLQVQLPLLLEQHVRVIDAPAYSVRAGQAGFSSALNASARM